MQLRLCAAKGCVIYMNPRPIKREVPQIYYESHRPRLNIEVSYHYREYDGGHSGLEDPEQSQAKDLEECEEMDLPEGNVSQVHQVRLMLRWHQKQLKTIHKLQTEQVTNTHEQHNT